MKLILLGLVSILVLLPLLGRRCRTTSPHPYLWARLHIDFDFGTVNDHL